jgi:hypothetical protein
MVKDAVVEHPAAIAFTRTCEAICEVVLFTVVNAGMLLIPEEAGKPIAVVLAVQLIVAPGVLATNVKGPAVSPGQ